MTGNQRKTGTASMPNDTARKGRWVKTDPRIFVLDVCIFQGPMTEAFMEKNPSICRTIEMRGDQALEELHFAIFKAFNRKEEHMYEFQLNGEGPMDPKADRYVLPTEHDMDYGGGKPAGTVLQAVGSLDLKKDDIFGYWFDFGDDWFHQINVLEIKPKPGRGKYPRITDRIGASPPQYVNWD